MEDKKVDVSLSGEGHPASWRWNPTNEQISMLEALYREGIKTPSAEQIQEITSRLKAYGYLEEKNVFYWFQNHKARQRQKQKQKQDEKLFYINHSSRSPPILPSTPASSNVVCSPFNIQQRGFDYYPQCTNNASLLLGGIRRTPNTNTDKMDKRKENGGARYEYNMYTPQYDIIHTTNVKSNGNPQTLVLFPLHPTGILEEKSRNPFNTSFAVNSNQSTSVETFIDDGSRDTNSI